MSETVSSQAPDFSRDYRPPADRRDALWQDHRIRPHWLPYLDAIRQMGDAELRQQQSEIDRLLSENGVTFNVHGDPGGISRPWQLDPIPLIFDTAAWEDLETGLIQRARLFDRILSDLYGPQHLIRKGLLPPELVFGHRGFCRPCSDPTGPDIHHRLFLYAADLTNDADAGWIVLSDRTEAPSGAGYAVENRMVMDRLFPDLIRDCRVRRLSTFFRALRSGLEAAAPKHRTAPRVALMTPGPGHETYFEHAYLAAYLGYPLVQGADLTVRQGRVLLKTLDGLKPIDILLRRVDDHLCDPLELSDDSIVGVAGLLEAMRRGLVTVANPIGSSILENPGLAAFLPAIARHLLGEELRLASVPTWWCGDPGSRHHVLANLEQMVVRTLAGPPRTETWYGALMDRSGLDMLRRRIEARPQDFVGQAAVRFAAAPAWDGGRLEPRMTILRSFLAYGPDGYSVMPGGLTLSADKDATLQLAARSGGISKDTWIVADTPQMHISLWQDPGRSNEAASASTVLPSRAAENLFWVGRYAERTEGITRLLRTIARAFQRISMAHESADTQAVHALFLSLARLTATDAGAVDGGDAACCDHPEHDLLAMTTDPNRPGSLLSTLRSMLRAGHAVRHLWSNDSWRVLNRLEGFAEALAAEQGLSMGRLRGLLDELIMALMAFAGLNSESMTREQGWLLLDIGRRIERSLVLVAFLKGTLTRVHDTAVSHLLLESVLATTENIITYRHRYRNFMHLQTVLDQLLQDGSNPRSLLYQLRRLQKEVVRLPRQPNGERLRREEKLVLEAVDRLLLADLAVLIQPDADGTRYPALGDLLDTAARLAGATSDELNRTYFSHAQRPHQLTSTRLIVDSG